MVYDKSNVPTDVEQLQKLVISLSQSNAELHMKLDKMTTEMQRLTLLFEKFFNKSSQKLLQAQEEKEAEKQAKANADRRGAGDVIPCRRTCRVANNAWMFPKKIGHVWNAAYHSSVSAESVAKRFTSNRWNYSWW